MVTTRGPRGRGERRKSAQASRQLTKSISTPTPSAPKKEQKKTPLPADAEKVRVWWPPTDNKAKSDLSGMYWPAKVVKPPGGALKKYEVEYDNKEREKVDPENVIPYDQSVEHGKETTPLKVGEFCEVHNQSNKDPAEWVGVVKSVTKSKYTVSFPFHTADDEAVSSDCVRRARVYDEEEEKWSCIIPNQTWKDGDIASPWELDLCDPEEIEEYLNEKKDEPQDEKKRPEKVKKEEKEEKEEKKVEKEEKKAAKEKKATAKKAAKVKETGGVGSGPAVIETLPPPVTFSAGPSPVPIPVMGPGPEFYQLAAAMPMMQGVIPPVEEKVKKSKKRDAEGKEGKERKVRKKDKNAPKKPKSAYLIFLDRKRDQVCKDNPTLSMKEVMPLLAAKWKEVTDDELKICQEKASKEMDKYVTAMEEYNKEQGKLQSQQLAMQAAAAAAAQMMQIPPGMIPAVGPQAQAGAPGVQHLQLAPGAHLHFPSAMLAMPMSQAAPMQAPVEAQAAGNAKPKKDPNMPKRGHSAYICFSKAYHRQQKALQALAASNGEVGENINFEAMSKKIGDAWRALTHSERKVYFDLAKQEEERFNLEMKEYTENQAKKQAASVANMPPPFLSQPMPSGQMPPPGMVFHGPPFMGCPPPGAVNMAIPHEAMVPPRPLPVPGDVKPAEGVAEASAAAGAAPAMAPLPSNSIPVPAVPPNQIPAPADVSTSAAEGVVPPPGNVPIGAAPSTSTSVSTTVDMQKVRLGLKSIATDDAYYMIVDRLRSSKSEVEEAYTMFCSGKKCDWKAFLVGCLGLKETMIVLKKSEA
mmetsp:Transcript_11229/g.13267  ORF Transcript_11229/g.13267 Transcript_11229/m.13267 type:complete len:806 (-) Transcript_11229:463-2880(-)|eukprot:CAMPEP_0197865628 /NCGR_PEP_ID=MMETSP1438-20131217/43771_1 /TAXON_ID=1461541 /ORGANISM="Pterosperma sp., Strain CCMP1384" /LENGTH=805 /DNA_ID=CAMNT_0043484117 /DNA_START=72 /DNA_END=2489 /DNA_ORIENTATION=-